MAITTIPWGDGSGDNIYLTCDALDGDQTVLVSSDANTGYTSRSQTISFTASHHGTTDTKTLTVSQDGIPEEYLVFEDSLVESICANTWGDGIGLKPSQAATVTSVGSYFKGKAIVKFNELGTHFPNLTTIPANAFQNCTSLKYLTIPSSVTSLGSGITAGCTALIDLIVNATGNYSLAVFCAGGGTMGAGTGTFYLAGGITTTAGANYTIRFKKVQIVKNFSPALTNRYAFRTNMPQIMKIGGNVSTNYQISDGNQMKFFEVMGTITTNSVMLLYYNARSVIVHLGYEGVACGPKRFWANSTGNFNTIFSKFYVGDGSSAEHDNAILAQYMANSEWSSNSVFYNKLDTWYNYINSSNPNPDYL